MSRSSRRCREPTGPHGHRRPTSGPGQGRRPGVLAGQGVPELRAVHRRSPLGEVPGLWWKPAIELTSSSCPKPLSLPIRQPPGPAAPVQHEQGLSALSTHRPAE